MRSYIWFADRVSMWFGKAFAWCIMAMTFGTGYDVFMRKAFDAPSEWAYDLSYMMYGTLFMLAGAYTLSLDSHVRGDFIYRLWKPRTQAMVELVLYFLFYFPGIIALIVAGYKYASRSVRYLEVSVYSPAHLPIFQFKMIMVAAGILMLIQGIARVFRCIICIREGEWPPLPRDVVELEEQLIQEHELEILRHGTEAVDVEEPEETNDAENRQAGDSKK